VRRPAYWGWEKTVVWSDVSCPRSVQPRVTFSSHAWPTLHAQTGYMSWDEICFIDMKSSAAYSSKPLVKLRVGTMFSNIFFCFCFHHVSRRCLRIYFLGYGFRMDSCTGDWLVFHVFVCSAVRLILFVTVLAFFRSVCRIHDHFRYWISFLMQVWFDQLNRSMFLIWFPLLLLQ